MKRMSLICAVLAALLIGQCITPALAAGEGKVLYEQAATTSAYEGGLKWPTNTTVSVGRVTGVDGTSYPTYICAVSQDSFKVKGQSLTIEVADLALDTAAYGEMELTVRYALEDKLDPVVDATEDFRVYASTDGGKTWSANFATLKSHKAFGYAAIDSDRGAVLYEMVSTDLAALVKKGQVIDRLKIMPYGTFTNMWYSHRIISMTVNGYEGKSPVTAPVDEYITLNEKTIRQIVVERAYQVLDLNWTTDKLLVTDNHGTPLNHYPGWLYKGPVYVGTGIDSSWEMYQAAHDANGNITFTETSAICELLHRQIMFISILSYYFPNFHDYQPFPLCVCLF